MKSKWKEVPLSEIVSLIIDYRGKTPKKLGGDWSTQGIQALSAKNIKTREIVQPDTIRYLDSNMYQSWMKDEIQRGDILITSEAPFGEVFYWDSDEKIVLSQRLFAIRCKKEYYSPFVFQYMTSERFQCELSGRATGTTVTGLRQPELLKCLVSLPDDYQEQCTIADALSAIDARIALNKKINHHLEQMAQAIFKSWFVDFEPFSNGDFIESELGEIPVGWRVGSLSELITVKYGKDHKKLAAGTIPVFGSGGVMRFADTALYNDESVLIPRKGTLNNVIYVNQPFWSVDTMFYTEMRRPNLAKFIYFFVRSKNLASMNAGSAVPSMTTEILNSLPVVVPPDSELARYEEVVGAQFRQIQVNQAEIDKLAAIRDTLLPRLMSGELSVAALDDAK